MISRETAEIGFSIIAIGFMFWITVQFMRMERKLAEAEAKAESLQKVLDEDREVDYKQLQEALVQRHEELGIAVVVIRNLNDRMHHVTRAPVVERDLPTLAAEVSILFRLAPDLPTAEFIATALQCDVLTAVRAMGLSAENDAKGLP